MKQTGVIILLLIAFAAMVSAGTDDLPTRLQARQARVRFDQCQLSDALAITGESIHANVEVDWAALQAASVHQDAQVSMDFNNVSAATTLDVICRLVGGGSSWFVQDGLIRVTTQDQLDKQGGVKPYWPTGIGGVPEERAAKAATILREYVSGLGDDSIRISNGQVLVRGNDKTQERVSRVLQLCSRPMTPTEWRQMLGVEEDLNNSTDPMTVSWQSVPIAQCVNQLSAHTKIPMVLDASIDSTKPIMLEMKNATPRQILDGLLSAAASSGASSKMDMWTCEPTAQGQVLWIGPESHAMNWCACYMLGPAAMRQLRINSPQDGPSAICSAVGGCDGDHIRWVGGNRILCLQKMDQILAIGKILDDPSFDSAMRPNRADRRTASSGN
jgi:type II secretory pathway component GspD/PulD (secretin)